MKNVAVFYPCITDKTKVSCEFDIGMNIDLENISKKIANLKPKYSKKLGILKFGYKLKEIMIFDSGKVIIKKAENRKDAKNMIKFIKEIV